MKEATTTLTRAECATSIFLILLVTPYNVTRIKLCAQYAGLTSSEESPNGYEK
jgi:hypothetical protein